MDDKKKVNRPLRFVKWENIKKGMKVKSSLTGVSGVIVNLDIPRIEVKWNNGKISFCAQKHFGKVEVL